MLIFFKLKEIVKLFIITQHSFNRGLTQQRKKPPYNVLIEEQYHTLRKTWIAHIQLLTGDLHLKGKTSMKLKNSQYFTIILTE